MAAELSRLRSRKAVQRAMDLFVQLGRDAFLAAYGYKRARDYLVIDPRTGVQCDSKAIVGVAFGLEHPQEGTLKASDFSGGEATVVPLLHKLRFETVRIGEDWTQDEVDATVESYFRMLSHEARQEPYTKTVFNAELRELLNARSKGSVERKYQNVSAVLSGLGLPFVRGYKPLGNAQLLLRQAVQEYLSKNTESLHRVVDALEEVKTPAQRTFLAVLSDPPPLEDVVRQRDVLARPRLPRKVDYAGRDEANRQLGRRGEHWVLSYEHHRLSHAGRGDLLEKVSWVADQLGDGMGYDILSCETDDAAQRFIEVKTTNGPHATAFIVSRNELEFSKEVGDSFFLYRVFDFRAEPSLYMLRGDIERHVHLEPVDYRASFRRITA